MARRAARRGSRPSTDAAMRGCTRYCASGRAGQVTWECADCSLVTDILTPARRGLPYALAGPFRSFERNVVLVTLVPLEVMLLHATAVGLPLVAGIAVALGTPHVLATFGLYGDSELREVVRSDRVRLVWLPLLAIPMSALAFYVVNGSALLWLFTAFLIWQTHHFTKQNFGMVTFWTKAR